MNAVQVLKNAADAYTAARSYSDRGEVAIVFISGGKREVTHKPFATYFERPDRFRFEYRHGDNKYLDVILRNGGPATCFKGTEEVDVMKFSTALGGLAGVSSGSSCRVPSLLLPDKLSMWSLEMLRNARLEGEGQVDGVLCYQISALVNKAERSTFWFGKDDYLLRKVFEKSHYGDDPRLAIQDARLKAAGIPDSLRPPVRHARKSEFDAETTTSYVPEVGTNIDPQLFEKP